MAAAASTLLAYSSCGMRRTTPEAAARRRCSKRTGPSRARAGATRARTRSLMGSGLEAEAGAEAVGDAQERGGALVVAAQSGQGRCRA